MKILLLGLLISLGGPAGAGQFDHALGKALFDRLWISAPASTKAADGLGPLFNARSCATCHPRGGRGVFQEDGVGRISGAGLLLRVGTHAGAGDPVYGIQLQTLAVQGLKDEGQLRRLATGGIGAVGLTYGSPHDSTRMSGRLAPDLHGLGLLQQVSQAVILARADPDDLDRNGISGRANFTANAKGELVLSRYGWKAGKSTILMQSAAALVNDIGLSNPVYSNHFGDCTLRQTDCLSAAHGASPNFENLEIDSTMLGLIAKYVENLRPRKSSIDDQGMVLFRQTGCAACHLPELYLTRDRTIAAYTDLLLHDMGDALADGIGDGQATGREWRTAPLWGLRLAKRFLHDGRAHNLRGAIAFHGGEGTGARENFNSLPTVKQSRLIHFLSML